MISMFTQSNRFLASWILSGLTSASVVFCCQTLVGQELTEKQHAANQHFEKHIRPLLAQNCFDCHGPKTQWSSLRLDARKFVLDGGDSGPAIVPGKAAESLLISRIESTDEFEQMPPESSGKSLTKAEIKLLRDWIDAGAIWPETDIPAAVAANRDHWAFQPLQAVQPPAVAEASWVKTELDRFVLRKLEEEGLTPSAMADRRTLIRRATFDLTGLPPTPSEVDQFVADTRPDAYERLVDRLLASPAYGEHWARHWLDVARYSDTKGYVYGREERFFVHAAHYRDWVINSLNNDLPYDEFVRLQLAADQIAPENSQAAAAMGFLTLGRRFLGVEPDIIDDRIDVVTRGLLGLTVGCARCHDHKFDPIPTADYYSLYGVFQNSAEKTVPLPGIAAEGEVRQELEGRQQKLANAIAQARQEFADLARERVGDYLQAQFELEKYPQQAFSQILTKDDLLPTTVWRWQRYLQRTGKDQSPVFTVWDALADLPSDTFATEADAVLAKLRASEAEINPLVAQAFSTTPSSKAKLVERYTKLFQEVSQKWNEKVKQAAVAKSPIPERLDGDAEEALRQVLYASDSPCVIPDLDLINVEFDFDTSTCVTLWGLQKSVDQWIVQHADTLPHAVTMIDQRHIAAPRIFRRGNADNPGAEVPLRFLEILSGADRAPFAQGSGRLELANAIASPENPLTARVWVNRVWAHHFQKGIVRTPSDFGTRAEPPTHPELLDWLAQQFIAEGWSTKTLHKQIMLSATYQQSSQGPANREAYAQASKTDPENRLLWKMNPRRLSFEQFRDASLAVSDDLNRQPGGKGDPLFVVTEEGARRSVYGVIDRQSLPTILQTFDFANPDLHTPTRSETTVPQQALFGLNHPFLANRARSIAAMAKESSDDSTEQTTERMFHLVLQRDPHAYERDAAREFIQQAQTKSQEDDLLGMAQAWSYGYGQIHPESGTLTGFQPLPHFTGDAWQGGTSWPDVQLGWAQISADGGHPGNDLKHAIVRRWTAPESGIYAIESIVEHDNAVADGIRCWVLTSRGEVLRKEVVHNTTLGIDIPAVELKQGESIDFVVDILEILNSDQHRWSPRVSLVSRTAGGQNQPTTLSWDARQHFTGQASRPLDAWEQLAQVLLLSNEFLFVD